MKISIHLLLLLFVAFSANNFAQVIHTNHWYFGNNAGLDFSSGSPVPIGSSGMRTDDVKVYFESPSTVKVFSIAGKLIAEFDATTQLDLDVSNYSKGMYYLCINGTKTVRFVKE